MRIVGFQARGDLVGRRIRVAWEFWPEEGETLANVPRVVIRRKRRDFEYVATTPDPSVVYDSNDFPPADPLALVTELPGWEEREDDTRRVVSVLSVARPINGRNMEVARRTLTQVLDADGRPLRQRVELLDLGGQPDALSPGETCYYQLFSPGLPADASPEPYRSTATPAENHGMGRTLYEMLPQIYRRHDVVTRPSTPGDDTIPEMAGRSGQLRRMVDLFGTALSAIRSSAEGLRRLHDVDEVDARFLPLLAQWIGWELDQGAGAARHRNEIKTAARLYPTIGTLPGLRALVTQYTGWSSQVVEFAQHVFHSHQAPRYNLFATVERGAQWCGADDAAPLLGFGPGNDDASGAGTSPAQLLGTATEPFALHPGVSLTVAVDGGLPSTVRLAPGDFARLSLATAAEVAAALSAANDQLVATASGGRVRLATKSVGPASSLRVQREASSLLSLEAAPGGRLSAFNQGAIRSWLFFETRDAAAPPERPALASAVSPPGTQREGPREVVGRILYKARVDDVWRPARVALGATTASRGAPAAAPLPDGRIFLAWLDAPEAGEARHRFALGQPRGGLPARLQGTRRAPFVLTPGTQVVVATDAGAPELFTVNASDYANPAQATATEVVIALASQIFHAQPVVEADGSLRLETLLTGGRARLWVDLAQSTAARALGFGPEAAGPAHGSFDDTLDWSREGWLPPVAPGRHAGLTAAWDAPVGGLRLAWASHRGAPWKVWLALWTGRSAIATAAGTALREESGAITLLTTAQGLPSNDVRASSLDADGAWAFATAAGAALRRANGTTVVLNTGSGLPSNDVRDAAFEPAGGLWLATAAGAVFRRADGSLLVLTTAQGLPSNDVRRVALQPEGTAWLATGGGLVRRSPEGTLTSWTATSGGLPSSNVLAVALDETGTPWVATAAGLGVLRAGVFEPVTGLPAGDIRALAFDARGTVLVATAAGLASRRGEGPWDVAGTASGLPSNDVRSVWAAPTGEVWVATPAGAAFLGTDGSWRKVGTAEGLPSLDVRHFSGVWSTPRIAASAGAANVEPALVTGPQTPAWLLWSRREDLGASETWTLRQRRFDSTTLTWSSEAAVTTPPAGGRAADREPSAVPSASGAVRVFFRSDRSGGEGLHWLTLSAAGVPGALNALPADVARDRAPVPLALSPGTLWLAFRSERNVALAQAEAPAPAFSGARSARVPDPGALRRHAGSTSVMVDDVVRNRARRELGDLLSYTPQKPRGTPAEVLTDDDLYTRGTLGLYLSRGKVSNEITADEVSRLRALLTRFLPINSRAVVFVRPEPVIELAYPAGADIVESYADNHPFIETFPGPITDLVTAALPGWGVLHSNDAGDVSADPTDATTLRRRTHYPPPE